MKENNAMKGIIRRYKCLLDNIDDEVAKFAIHEADKRESAMREAVFKGVANLYSAAKESSNFVL